jgi:REP element-mobilizing transposase RayT
MQPIYTADNCQAAYELRWSLALFGNRAIPPAKDWLDTVTNAVETDGVRILEHTFRSETTLLFLLSTKPHASPQAIVKSVKGRLQHAVRATHPELFKWNFSLTSIGEVRREAVETYVSQQLGHHRMADQKLQERLADFQLCFLDVDLSQARFSTHGRCLCNLHLVLVHRERWSEVGYKPLAITREMVLQAAARKGHSLSRLAVLPEHLHVTLGFSWNESPADVALAYLNNLAYAHGMKPLFQFGYFVGTFGEYDLDAVRRKLAVASPN